MEGLNLPILGDSATFTVTLIQEPDINLRLSDFVILCLSPFLFLIFYKPTLLKLLIVICSNYYSC
jgi:hypothetical protein